MERATFGPEIVRKLLKFYLSCAAIAVVALVAPPAPARAQDTAAEGAAKRAAVLARLPADAAQRAFGLAPGP